ncbi:MAG TPA: hypothetical protein VFM46_15130, partial [Pseudomonadales bacterium]|nr:hypothetical protein [Pseudomonadales bacterium]
MRLFNQIEKWSEQRIDKIARWIVRSPVQSMLLVLAIVIASATGLKGYTFTLDYRAFFSKENPQLLAFEKLQDDYAKTDAILIAIEPKDGNVFSQNTLQAVHEITERSWKIPYSQRVDSITNFQRITVTESEIRADTLFPDVAAISEAKLADAKAFATKEPFLVNLLINPQASVTAVRVNINLPGIDHKKEVPEVV